LQECIESYTTHFYAKVVIEVIDGATAKEFVEQIRKWIQDAGGDSGLKGCDLILIWSLNVVFYRPRKGGLKLMSEIPEDVNYQAEQLGDALGKLENCFIVAPGNDELWLSAGFLEKAEPLVDRMFSRADKPTWNGVAWYEGLDKRMVTDHKEKLKIDSTLTRVTKNIKLVTKTLVEIATLSNFFMNLEVANNENVKSKEGDQISFTNVKGRVEIINRHLDEESKRKSQTKYVITSDKLRAKHLAPALDAGDRVEEKPKEPPALPAGGDSGPKDRIPGFLRRSTDELGPKPTNDISGWLRLELCVKSCGTTQIFTETKNKQ
jgi:hypothetical protein